MYTSNTIAIFDFDNTLIVDDSFRLFSLMAADGAVRKIMAFVLAVFCKFGFLDNRAYKERVLKLVWSDKHESEKAAFLEIFLRRLHQLENTHVVALLNQHIKEANIVAIISASPELYLEPFVKSWSTSIITFGSKLKVLNGQILVDNLYGNSKAEIANTLINRYQPSSILVYTDHISDLSLIKLATHVSLVSPSNSCMRKLRGQGIKFEIV